MSEWRSECEWRSKWGCEWMSERRYNKMSEWKGIGVWKNSSKKIRIEKFQIKTVNTEKIKKVNVQKFKWKQWI